jgi:hypothetical protein
LDLPQNIECASCWIGKQSDSKITFKNHGGHAGFWLTEDPAVKLETLMTDFDNPQEFVSSVFTVYPDRFFLRKGESITLHINFNPSTEGKFTTELLLACDNMKTYGYNLSAEANMIQLLTTQVDGCSLTDDPNKLMDMIYFLDNEYGTTQTRTLSIENLTKNKIDYELKFISDDGSHFSVSPAQGIFMSGEVKDFNISYKAFDPITCYDKMELIIKNIPLKSVKDPPPHIQKMIERLEIEKKKGRDVDENEKIEFTYFTYNLVGQVQSPSYEVTPPLIYYPFSIPLNKPETSVITIKNAGSVPSVFKI